MKTREELQTISDAGGKGALEKALVDISNELIDKIAALLPADRDNTANGHYFALSLALSILQAQCFDALHSFGFDTATIVGTITHLAKMRAGDEQVDTFIIPTVGQA